MLDCCCCGGAPKNKKKKVFPSGGREEERDSKPTSFVEEGEEEGEEYVNDRVDVAAEQVVTAESEVPVLTTSRPGLEEIGVESGRKRGQDSFMLYCTGVMIGGTLRWGSHLFPVHQVLMSTS